MRFLSVKYRILIFSVKIELPLSGKARCLINLNLIHLSSNVEQFQDKPQPLKYF